MKCPSCGKDMLKSNSHVFCPHCGYLDDGKQIHGYEEHQASDLEIYLGDEYEKIWWNENWYVSFLLGPLYLCYRGFIILGLVLAEIEFQFWDAFGNSFSTFSPILQPLAFLITRMFFSGVNNMICIYFYQTKINRIKKKHPNDYIDILRKKRKQISTPISIAIILLVFVIGIIFFLYYILDKTGYFWPF